MDKTTRRKFLKVAGTGGVAAAASTLAAPAIAQAQPEIRWRMTTSWPKSLDALHGGAEYISRRVAEMTDGKFQIQIFAAGELVPGLQVLDAVQNGTVECGHSTMYYFYGKDDAMVFMSVLPFGMNSRMQSAWQRHGGGQELINEYMKSYNTHLIPAGNTHAQMGGWFRKQIKTVDDLKGLKFRIGGFAGRAMQRLGVVPQQIAGGDIYAALEKGTIDGAEWVGPYDDEKLGFVKVAKFYHYPGWWEANAAISCLVNLEKWNALPPAYKAVLTAASAEGKEWIQEKYDASNPMALKRLVASGAVLTPFPPDVMDACWKASQEVYAELNAKNAWFKRFYDSYTAFMSDGYLWHQVADYTMDSYMIRYRNAQKG